MKKEYIAPTIKITEFQTENIVMLSGKISNAKKLNSQNNAVDASNGFFN